MVAEVSSLRHLGAGVAFTQDTDTVEAFSNPTLRVVRRGIASAISKVALKGYEPSFHQNNARYLGDALINI